MRLLPWPRRPRRHLRQVLDQWNWRFVVFPYIFAPMMIGKLAWPLWGGPKTSGVDLLILVGSLLPWAFLAAWLRRPTSYIG